MRRQFYICGAVAAFVLCIGGSVTAQSQHPRAIDPAVARLGGGFTSGMATVNGTRLYFVRGGSGPVVILLHGFPQDWYEWRKTMPLLAKTFTVVAVDLRGVGKSSEAKDGYDAANLAEDIHQLAQQLKLEHAYVVGHDVGGMVAYALARLHPGDMRGVMILECPIPGTEPWEKVKSDPALWHINFQGTPELPEQLVEGRQEIYFRHFFCIGTIDHSAISDADVAHYVEAYASPLRLRAAFEVYREFPANEKFNAAHRDAIKVPLVLAGGDRSFGKVMTSSKDVLGAYGWESVRVEVLPNLAHYIPDEQPEKIAELIKRYAVQP
jgi:pimeloyl-ACP methyl ester carboxylesterase